VRKFPMLMAAAAMGALAMSSAHATPTLEYSIDGGATFNTFGTSGGGLTSFNGTLGSFTVTLSSLSNTPGSPNLSELLSSTLQVANTSTSMQSLEFLISDVGFTTPVAPPNLLLNSHIGGSVVVGGSSNTLSFTSSVHSGTNPFASGALTAGPGTPNITSAGSFDNDKTSIISLLTAPYAIGQDIKITLAGGSSFNFADNTTLAPVPEPTSLVLLGSSLVGLGFVSRKMRQSKKG
jgi:hypothetical protein